MSTITVHRPDRQGHAREPQTYEADVASIDESGRLYIHDENGTAPLAIYAPSQWTFVEREPVKETDPADPAVVVSGGVPIVVTSPDPRVVTPADLADVVRRARRRRVIRDQPQA